ncbi:MAG: M48 family metallopeptidase [Bacteroidota bacterium]
MKKLLIALLILAGIGYALSRVQWSEVLGLTTVTDSVEKQLGDMFWEQYAAGAVLSTDPSKVDSIEAIIRAMCVANDIDPAKIKLHVVETPEVNAFALPDHHMVVNTGLLNFSRHPEEVAGVLGHEIAHMELSHVMKKLGKEIGLTVIMMIVGGDAGAEIIKRAIGTLSSSAYDRSLEKDADLKAVDYMHKANMNPKMLSSFLARLAEESQTQEALQWLSSHPDTQERVRYIDEKIRKLDP